MDRRKFLKYTAAASSLTLLGSSRKTLAKSNGVHPKFIWILLRGAQDSLSTLIPHNEVLLTKYRPKLWPMLKPTLLPITNDFSLHPKLGFFKQLFQSKELIPISSVSTGYNSRSHFEGQDVLECGFTEIDYSSGWIGRLSNIIDGQGIAISRSMPLSSRGSKIKSNWYPNNFRALRARDYKNILQLYSNDIKLEESLISALRTRKVLGSHNMPNENFDSFRSLCRNCGTLLTKTKNYSIATLELEGWDTHSDQHKILNEKMEELNNGVTELVQSLGKEWSNTTLAITTEFGRAAKENGTMGTDHGTGSTMFIAGGNVNGGRVAGSYLGLKKDALLADRDLKPTSNTFKWINTLLTQQFSLKVDQRAYLFGSIGQYADSLINFESENTG